MVFVTAGVMYLTTGNCAIGVGGTTGTTTGLTCVIVSSFL